MMRLLVLLVAGAAAQANTMNKVIEMLVEMKSAVEKELQASEGEWEEHGEWFRRTKQETEYNVKDAKDRFDAASATAADSAAQVQEAEGKIAEFAAKINQDETDLKKATEVRESERKDFEATSADLSESIDMLVRAAGIIRKATGGSGSAGNAARMRAGLAQIAGSLQVVMKAAFVSFESRKKLQVLLQADKDEDAEEEETPGYVQPTAAKYTQHSSGIMDLLADLKQEAEGELRSVNKKESEGQHAFNMLRQSLQDAIADANKGLEDTKALKAEQTEINEKANGEAVKQDGIHKEAEKYLAELIATHETETANHEASVADSKAEIAAVAKAIEILSQKGFKSATEATNVLLQVSQAPDARAEVAAMLQRAAHRFSSVEFAMLAVRAKDDPFAKVKGLISDMIARLQKQAAEEAEKKAYCDKERAKNEKVRDDRAAKLDKYSARLDKAQAEKDALKQQVAQLSDDLAEAEENMKAATELRQQQAGTYAQLMSDTTTGLDGIAQAIQALKEYYGQESVRDNKSDSATNVIALLETAQADLIKMKTDGEQEEAAAQEAFTKMQNDYEVTKASKEAERKGAETEIASLTNSIRDLKNDVKSTSEELDAVLNYLEKLKDSCTHKVMSFEERAAKMQQEIASLQQALEILENETAGGDAPAGFLQK
jgi:chromosome segregation ATPase